jgi:hypothetical protein
MSQVVAGENVNGALLEFPAAVVEIVTATGVAELPVTFTDAGTPQTGAGVTVGLMLQAKFTIPLNDPAGESVKLKVAVPPAEIVDELPPVGILIVKSDAAMPVRLKPIICGELDALSVIWITAVRSPAPCGEKVIPIVQFEPAWRLVPQVLVCW